MIVASHQIDILPYPGFFNRMCVADVFDLSGHYDLWRKGKGIYQHRVMIGTDSKPVWMTLPVIAHHGMKQNEVMLDRERMVECFYDKIAGVYSAWPYFGRYKNFLMEQAENAPAYLWQFNFAMLLWARDVLNITTPLAFAHDYQEKTASAQIAAQVNRYGSTYHQAMTYYSGAGGKNYLNKEDFDRRSIDVVFQDYSKIPVPEGFRTVSILSLIMKYSPEKAAEYLRGFSSEHHLTHGGTQP